jgi:hypothetical protein
MAVDTIIAYFEKSLREPGWIRGVISAIIHLRRFKDGK